MYCSGSGDDGACMPAANSTKKLTKFPAVFMAWESHACAPFQENDGAGLQERQDL